MAQALQLLAATMFSKQTAMSKTKTQPPPAIDPADHEKPAHVVEDPVSSPLMKPTENPTTTVAPVLLEPPNGIESQSLESLRAEYLANQSPNKGSERDYLERKLSVGGGWRMSEDGKSIYRLVNSFGGSISTQPDPSMFDPNRAAAQAAQERQALTKSLGLPDESTAPKESPEQAQDEARKQDVLIDEKPVRKHL